MVSIKKIKEIKKKVYKYLDPTGYPRCNLYKRSKINDFTIRNLSKWDENLDKFRRKFWTFIAKRHQPFSCCYSKDYLESSNESFKEIQKNGFVEIKDFLKPEDFDFVCKEFESRIEKIKKEDIFKGANKGYHRISNESSEIINDTLSPLIKCCFGKYLSPLISLNLILSQNGQNDLCSTANWHADRFIPCINALYFPFGCDWLPFQRLISSPYIKDDNDAMARQTHYKELTGEANIYKSICPPNTLIIGFHHILHRRSDIETPGQRICVFLEWYRSFNRIELLKSFSKSFFKRIS